MYNPQNVFAKILRSEIPCTKVYEDDYALAFEDLYPKAPIHILIIPKGPYESFSDFTRRASDEEINGFFKAVTAVTQQLGIIEQGYRLITNEGLNAHQEVPHFHIHLLAGKALGPLLSK